MGCMYSYFYRDLSLVSHHQSWRVEQGEGQIFIKLSNKKLIATILDELTSSFGQSLEGHIDNLDMHITLSKFVRESNKRMTRWHISLYFGMDNGERYRIHDYLNDIVDLQVWKKDLKDYVNVDMSCDLFEQGLATTRHEAMKKIHQLEATFLDAVRNNRCRLDQLMFDLDEVSSHFPQPDAIASWISKVRSFESYWQLVCDYQSLEDTHIVDCLIKMIPSLEVMTSNIDSHIALETQVVKPSHEKTRKSKKSKAAKNRKKQLSKVGKKVNYQALLDKSLVAISRLTSDSKLETLLEYAGLLQIAAVEADLSPLHEININTFTVVKLQYVVDNKSYEALPLLFTKGELALLAQDYAYLLIDLFEETLCSCAPVACFILEHCPQLHVQSFSYEGVKGFSLPKLLMLHYINQSISSQHLIRLLTNILDINGDCAYQGLSFSFAPDHQGFVADENQVEAPMQVGHLVTLPIFAWLSYFSQVREYDQRDLLKLLGHFSNIHMKSDERSFLAKLKFIQQFISKQFLPVSILDAASVGRIELQKAQIGRHIDAWLSHMIDSWKIDHKAKEKLGDRSESMIALNQFIIPFKRRDMGDIFALHSVAKLYRFHREHVIQASCAVVGITPSMQKLVIQTLMKGIDELGEKYATLLSQEEASKKLSMTSQQYKQGILSFLAIEFSIAIMANILQSMGAEHKGVQILRHFCKHTSLSSSFEHINDHARLLIKMAGAMMQRLNPDCHLLDQPVQAIDIHLHRLQKVLLGYVSLDEVSSNVHDVTCVILKAKHSNAHGKGRSLLPGSPSPADLDDSACESDFSSGGRVSEDSLDGSMSEASLDDSGLSEVGSSGGSSADEDESHPYGVDHEDSTATASESAASVVKHSLYGGDRQAMRDVTNTSPIKSP